MTEPRAPEQPDRDEDEDGVCPECRGSGTMFDEPCPRCNGSGKLTEGIGGG